MTQDREELERLLARRDKADAALLALHEKYPDPADADEPDRGFRAASYECDVSQALLANAAVNALPSLLAQQQAAQQRIEAMEAGLRAFNITRENIVSGTADSLTIRVPITVIQSAAALLTPAQPNG